MKRMALAAALLMWLATPAPAQVLYAGGFGFSVRGPNVRVQGFAGGFYNFPGYSGFYPGYGPGWGPGYGNPYFLPPPAGLAPPCYYRPPVIVIVNNGFAGGVLPNNPFAQIPNDPPDVVQAGAKNVPNNAPPLGAQPGQFIMITPKGTTTNAANPMIPTGTTSPMVAQVATLQPRPLVPVFDPFATNPLTNVEIPEADPRREFARLMKLAGDTFAAGEYGRCVGFLDRANKANATDALPHFLKAQCLFATGQYGDAVDAIRDGLKLAPDWPASAFRPRDFYGTAPDRYDVHLAALRKSLAENPGEPVLQFLLGYELWFSGNQAEATELFRAAARGAKGNAMIARFVKAAGAK